MPRGLFEKTGNAVYISHLDLMRIFQRGFKRAGLSLTHTKGFNPRPSVSIALPLSLGVESHCELLDFDLEGERVSCHEIKNRLNDVLIEGVRILDVYDTGAKIKDLAFLSCDITMEYDNGIPTEAESCIAELFARSEVTVEKKGKNGVAEQNIAPMIQTYEIERINNQELVLHTLICCQNPSLNPALLVNAIGKYIPHFAPDFSRISRREIYNSKKKSFDKEKRIWKS